MVPRNKKDVLHAGAIAIAYAAIGFVTLSMPETGLAFYRMVWLPSGLALAWMMLGGIQLWPGVFIGAGLVTALTGGPPLHVLGTAIANAGETALAVWLLGRWGVGPAIESRRDLLRFVIVLLAVTAVAASISVGSLALSGGSVGRSYDSLLLMWWLTHAMGITVLTPLILSLPAIAGPPPRLPLGESVFSSLGLLLALTVSFTPWSPAALRDTPMVFLSFPFLFWAAYRCGQFGASSASLAVAVFAISGTLLGSGPFVHESANTSLFLTLVFVSGVVFSTLFVAGLVGERRQAERAREALERRLHRSEKLESLGALAGGIAHDFNNMLVAIAGNVDLALMDTDPSDPNHDLLRESLRASERAAELCRQLLGYAGQGPFEHAVLDLEAVVTDMSELLRVTVPTGTELEYHTGEEPLPIRADPNQLRQVLVNLFSNAGDALLTRGGRITVTTVRIEDHADLDGDGLFLLEPPAGPNAMLRVEDDGEGIAPEDLERIFQPVFSTRGTGRGIGLASVLGVVRRHGGSVHVESTPGKGSTFTVLLPIAEMEFDQPSPPPIRPFDRSGTALIVDDEESVRAAAALLVRRLGFNTLEATDGDAALQALERNSDSISWVLLDVTMPGMDGLTTLTRLRERGCRVPVLVSSGYLQQSKDVARELGPASFLPKPYTLAALDAAVAELLSDEGVPA
ncbi:MAG: MASE1 domain-containing protein [Gemmatimonadetes bacterium]|nr:MASE1 domain-containing protein [Gemmatimonadota bacterium]